MRHFSLSFLGDHHVRVPVASTHTNHLASSTTCPEMDTGIPNNPVTSDRELCRVLVQPCHTGIDRDI